MLTTGLGLADIGMISTESDWSNVLPSVLQSQRVFGAIPVECQKAIRISESPAVCRKTFLASNLTPLTVVAAEPFPDPHQIPKDF